MTKKDQIHQYDQLLKSTIDHLESLSEKGVSYLEIEEGLLENLISKPSSSLKIQDSKVGKFEIEDHEDHEIGNQKVEDSKVEIECMKFDQTLSHEKKLQEMGRLKDQASTCEKCPNLAKSRRNIVFGKGSFNADLIFVGEAPGMDEDEKGEPFVGRAGQLLTKIIEAMGLSRKVVYVGNVLKCRPDTPNQSYGNRKPDQREMATCRPFIIRQIQVIQPKIIVALGATAVEGLMKIPHIAITKYRGTFRDFGGIPLMPTYHPSYILRNPSPRVKRQIWEDMLKVMKRLSMPISEKQLGYFSRTS